MISQTILLFVAFATFQLSSAFIASDTRIFGAGSSKKNGLSTSPSTSSLLLSTTYSLEEEELEHKFSTLKKAFPVDIDVVKAGGWYNLKKLSGDPKTELVNLIVDGLKNGNSNSKAKSSEEEDESSNKIEFDINNEKIEALSILLYGMGKGFEADLVDGDWYLVFTKQGTSSPKFQKLVGKGEKAGLSLNVFDIKSMTFSGDVKLLRNKFKVDSKVKYSPQSTGYSKTSDGKIVLRKIGCDIIKAGIKFWRLPRLGLPFLRRKGGYLEFVYMDKDIRITKGNRGGLFVHFRPEFLEQQIMGN